MEKYTKVKKIGEGSFGTAFLVRNKQSNKQFVIKEINIAKMPSKERQESRKEVAVLAQMGHPNIVTYRESFEETGSLYIVMDFCDGGDLYSKINAQRGVLFGEDQIMDWFVQTCLAIKHIHDRKILHRDIKSQNIFLTRAGIVKLGDFGIAKVLNSTVELARTCIGTPYYLSPEICENKPYNNKSDVWSLGCVLYELTTLKHAFEAGNMKNLVLKIIRGSYPPVSPKYSYDLRNIIALLFKRNARDRPSVNTLLKKPHVQKRIQKFLSDTLMVDEFSHTVMHGQKIMKQLNVGAAGGGAGQGLGVRPKPAAVLARKAPVPAVAAPKYNPAAKYGQPVVARNRRSAENRKSDDKKKPPSGGAKPGVGPGPGPGPAPAVGGVAGALNQDFGRNRQEMVDREKKRLEQRRKEHQLMSRQHQNLIEKQRMQRINQAREEGWKNMVCSLGSEKDKDDNKEKNAISNQPDAVQRERGNYDHYNQFLDDLNQKKGADKVQGVPPAAVWPDKDAVSRALYHNAARPAQVAAGRAEVNRVLAAEAVERAKVVEDFLQRKREAAVYRQRGVDNLFGNDNYNAPAAGQKRPYQAIAGRNNEEQDYLERLRQIREHNYKERRGIKQVNKGDPRNDPEARKKKIEALKAQADARAQQLKQQLEKKRREAFEREQHKMKNILNNMPAKRAVDDRPIAKAQKPAPVIPLTNVMNAIGVNQQPERNKPQILAVPPVGMTKALGAIGAAVEPTEKSHQEDKTPFQKEKILKNLKEKDKPSRSKWGEPKKFGDVERPKWGEGDANSLSDMPLQQTSSVMEATSAENLVLKNPGVGEAVGGVGRKQWGKAPSSTAVNILKGAKVIQCAETITIKGDYDHPDTVARSEKVLPKEKMKISSETIVLEKKLEIKSPRKVSPRLKSPCGSGSKAPSAGDSSGKLESPTKLKSESPIKEKEVQESQGKKLFDNVELIEEDEDTKNKDDIIVEDMEDSEDEKNQDFKQKSLGVMLGLTVGSLGVMLGLTVGHFDVPDPKMLKTSSCPDLARLFLTNPADNPFLSQVGYSVNVTTAEPVTPAVTEEDLDSDNEDDIEAINVEGENEEILPEIYDIGGEQAEKDPYTIQADEDKDIDESQPQDEGQETHSSEEENADDEGNDDDDDDQDQEEEDMRHLMESMQNLLTGAAGTKNKKSSPHKVRTNQQYIAVTDNTDGQDIEEIDSSSNVDDTVTGTLVPLKEAWQSDEDDTASTTSDDDKFCQLEETRVTLECELGDETFLKAYKTVQAIHEDDDEVIEDGQKIISDILGAKKKHLYDKILQLVMADGAFLEDND